MVKCQPYVKKKMRLIPADIITVMLYTVCFVRNHPGGLVVKFFFQEFVVQKTGIIVLVWYIPSIIKVNHLLYC